MSNVAKNAILRAKIQGVITDLMVKTTSSMVYVDDTTTLAAKLAEIVTSVNEKAKTTDLTTAINSLRQEMLGDTPVEAYNTFTELAAYISEHQEAADALTAAVGNKAEKSVVETIQATLEGLGALATKSTVAEDDLDSALKSKINSAAAANHGHDNKTVLDGITAAKVTNWDAAEQNAKTYADGLNTAMDGRVDALEANTHTHANKTVLDGITADNVTAWNAKGNIYYSATEPATLTENDLWFAIVE